MLAVDNVYVFSPSVKDQHWVLNQHQVQSPSHKTVPIMHVVSIWTWPTSTLKHARLSHRQLSYSIPPLSMILHIVTLKIRKAVADSTIIICAHDETLVCLVCWWNDVFLRWILQTAYRLVNFIRIQNSKTHSLLQFPWSNMKGCIRSGTLSSVTVEQIHKLLRTIVRCFHIGSVNLRNSLNLLLSLASPSPAHQVTFKDLKHEGWPWGFRSPMGGPRDGRPWTCCTSHYSSWAKHKH